MPIEFIFLGSIFVFGLIMLIFARLVNWDLTMGVRENKVEKYLDQRITLFGGLTRKWVSPGRDGVPDRIVFYHRTEFDVTFVEVKTTDGELSVAQEREQNTLRKTGVPVTTVYGNSGVDAFIDDLVTAYDAGDIKPEYR